MLYTCKAWWYKEGGKDALKANWRFWNSDSSPCSSDDKYLWNIPAFLSAVLCVLNVLGLLSDYNFNKGIFHILKKKKKTPKAPLCNKPLHPKKGWRKRRKNLFSLSVHWLAAPESFSQKCVNRFWLYCNLKVILGLSYCVSLGNLSHISGFLHYL